MRLLRSMTLIGAITLPLVAAGTFYAVPASAAGTVLYQYNFSAAKVSGSAVPNQATGMFAGVSLKLSGDWSFANNNQGILFTGNIKGKQSGADGKPSSGDSIDVANADTLGVGVQFTFHAPPAQTCTDTPNIAQIGRSGTPGEGQVKVQLSSCTPGQPTFVECRIAGSKSNVHTDTPVKVAKLALTPKHQYNVRCSKGAGASSSGKATITVTVIDKSTKPNTTVTASASRVIGDVVSKQDISAANKFPLPKPADNTDQFNGILYTASFCSGMTVGDINTCITSTFRKIT